MSLTQLVMARIQLVRIPEVIATNTQSCVPLLHKTTRIDTPKNSITIIIIIIVVVVVVTSVF